MHQHQGRCRSISSHWGRGAETHQYNKPIISYDMMSCGDSNNASKLQEIRVCILQRAQQHCQHGFEGNRHCSCICFGTFHCAHLCSLVRCAEGTQECGCPIDTSIRLQWHQNVGQCCARTARLLTTFSASLTSQTFLPSRLVTPLQKGDMQNMRGSDKDMLTQKTGLSEQMPIPIPCCTDEHRTLKGALVTALPTLYKTMAG
jgi:hypothetical protein